MIIYTNYNQKPDLRAMFPDELAEIPALSGEKKFRVKQLFSWMHDHKAASFDEMTNLPKSLRDRLAEETELVSLKVVQEQISALDGTRKYLFELADGNLIESVYMEYSFGSSVCISSQAGCRMGCRFCASTIAGLERNLTASEMLEQVYRIGRMTGKRISHVVIMGSGEPLDNYDNVLRFLRLITSSQVKEPVSRRNLTLSTCGLVPMIYRLAEDDPGVTLALSLHAADDETRRSIMPIARKYTIAQILEACDAYFQATGRRVSFEYSLIKGVNDGAEEAEKLSGLLKGRNCHVNLIPVNPVKERSYETVSRGYALHFKKLLEKNGINATIRREMGRDIDGACGQLRRSYSSKKEEKTGQDA